jgi:cell division protein FtsQ
MTRKPAGAKEGGKAATARRARRRTPAPVWLGRTMTIAAAAGALAAVVGGPAWLWHSGWAGRAADTAWKTAMARSVRLGLSVQEVQLEGRRHASREEIAAAIGAKRGAAILDFDLAAMRRRLEALPWVRAAGVERRLPTMLRVSIRERRPMALWQRDGRFVLVDDRGEKITDRDLGRFRDLVILIGEDAPRHAPTLFAMIASEPDLARRVAAATRVGERRWNLTLRGGIQVQLPEEEPHRAWRRLALLDERHRLLERDIRTIDMRLPDRLIVKPGALGAQARRLKGQST